MKNKIIAGLFLLFLIACSSLQQTSLGPGSSKFDQIALGSDEIRVKSLMGSPSDQVRLAAEQTDHWLYTSTFESKSRMFATFHFNSQKQLISKTLEWPAAENLKTIEDVKSRYSVLDLRSILQAEPCPSHTHAVTDDLHVSESSGLSVFTDAQDHHVVKLSWTTADARSAASIERTQKTCHGYNGHASALKTKIKK